MTRKWFCVPVLLSVVATTMADVPEMTVSPVAAPPVIDGKLDDACWKDIKPLSRFHTFPGGALAEHRTVTKVAYDSSWLYVAVDCQSPRPKEMRQEITQHDGGVASDESVEVFLDPGTEGRTYFHYLLNCINVRDEKRMSKTEGRDVHWDVPWRSATQLTDKGWRAEIAIPLYEPASYGDLAEARINITRNTIFAEYDQYAARIGDRKVMSSWAPVAKSFHEPEHFGVLKGLSGVKLKAPFLVRVDEAAIGGYTHADGSYGYDASFVLRAFTPTAGKVAVAVVDRPVSGEGGRVEKIIELSDMKRRPQTIRVPVETLVQRQVRVVLSDAASGEVLQTARVVDTSVLNLLDVYLDRSYYTTEKEAIAVCAVGLPESSLKQTRLAATDAAGKVLAEAGDISSTTEMAVPIDGLSTGRHVMTVQLRQADGKPIFGKDIVLKKLAPKPGREWKIDQTSGGLLNNGKPFFPYGFICTEFPAENEGAFKEMADAGFNSVANWLWRQEPEEEHLYHEVAGKYGLKVLARPEVYSHGVKLDVLDTFLEGKVLEMAKKTLAGKGLTHVKGFIVTVPEIRELPWKKRSRIFAEYYNANEERMLQGVRNGMNYETVIGYNLFDEPSSSRHFSQYEQGRRIYRRIHEIDGYHPCFLLYSSWIPKGDEHTDWADALGTDPYWVPGGIGMRGDINYVSKITTLTRQRAEQRRQAVWIVPMTQYYSGCHKRALQPEEQRCQTYLSLIHGAKAIFYFIYPVYHQGLWETMSGLAGEVNTLTPALVAKDVRQETTYNPGEFDAEKDKFPDVQVCLRRNPDGGHILLAANTRNHPVDVTYTLSSLPGKGRVRRLFAEGKLRVRKGAFSDGLEPFATRAYRLDASRTDAEPVEIRVDMTVDSKTRKPRETSIPKTGRPGKKNIAPNPSFEEATVPNWPDYYKLWYSDNRIGTPNQDWGQDTTDPYHGKVCLRMTKTRKHYSGFYVGCVPKHDEPTPYVCSVYLKGSYEGQKVYLGGGAYKYKTIKLTTSWERYHVAGTVPARSERHGIAHVRLIGDGVAWADAVQFEQGTKPTEFEP